MDCHEAKAKLELTTIRVDSLTGQDLAEARRHLSSCPACQQAFQSQQQFDEVIAQRMSDVPVPAGLVQRLTETIPQQPANAASDVPTQSPRWPRRLAWTALALIPLFTWSLLTRPAPLNESAVATLASLDLSTSPIAGPARTPAGWKSLRVIQWGDGEQQVTLQGNPVPVTAFVAQVDRRQAPAAGFLLELDPAQWHESDLPESFSAASIQYATFGAWTVWRENDKVYVCVLRDNAHVMQRLQEALRSAAFASA